MNSPTLAFEHVLASLARLEARIDESERRAAIGQHPARPDPVPPDENWRRERPDPGRQTAIFTSATATSPRDRLGFGGGSPSLGPLHAAPPGASPWDRSGETVASHQQLEFVGPSARNAIHLPRMEQQPWDRFDAGVEGFRGRLSTAWDKPAHRLDAQPRGLATEWERCGAGNDSFRARRPTAWDNPAHRFEDHPRQMATEWDQPRYDHYRVEKPCYEKMRAPIFDGLDSANLRAVHVDENQKIGAVSSWQIPTEITELRKKHDADALQVSSVSITNTNIITEKGSDLVSLSTPATNTGGHDAIAVRSSGASASSSALDLIKKKLQDYGILDSSSSPFVSGSVAVELNGSKPMEDTMKYIQNDNKDKNGDGDISNSSSDFEDEEGGPTMEDCLLQFKEMLKERGVAPFSKWEKELPKIVFDPRFKAIPDQSARRALFEHYLLEEAKDIGQNTDYQTFKRRWGEDPRFLSLDRREREHLLNERVLLLKRSAQEKAQAHCAVKTSNFKSLLKDREDITSTSRWSKVKDSLRSDPRYKSVKHEDREKLFNEYVAELQATVEETAQKAKAKQDEEDEIVILEGMIELQNKFKILQHEHPFVRSSELHLKLSSI
ncbi:hypothetical protein SASPL_157415 [Salvia splendens]|uniref:FF domain-containing protein n=1 Tax=Salvia splendens TaxID=180675 RepID=A0A8X8VUY5_SALSN|nr:hypothetical protein SASPL_157415 [Salvia splendens]